MTIQVAGQNLVLVKAVSNTTTIAGNSTNPNPSSTARTQQFAANIVGEVNAGVIVDGLGLQFSATGGNSIDVVNAGSVGVTTGGNGLTDVLEINGNGGDISYRGTGDITHFISGAAGDGLSMTNTGSGDITILD